MSRAAPLAKFRPSANHSAAGKSVPPRSASAPPNSTPNGKAGAPGRWGFYTYLILAARYEKVRQGGRGLDGAVRIALGIGPDGQRSLLGVRTALSAAEGHWRTGLTGRQKRGRHGRHRIVSDDHAGLRAARTAVFPSVPWPRGQCHWQPNAHAFVPRWDQRAAVAAAIRSVCNCPDRPSAESRLKPIVTHDTASAPKLAAWREKNRPQGFTVFSLPAAQQRRLRTTNALERVNRELKRRTRIAGLFPNEASRLRRVSAWLAEFSDEWETGTVYLNLECPT